jgi:Tfp pilus assembly protein PilF
MTKDEGDSAPKASGRGRAEAAPNIGRGVTAAADYEAACGFLMAGKLAEAETLLRKVVLSDPGHAGAHNDLGVIFSHRGKTEQAVDHFEKAIELAPGSADAYTNLGNHYHAAGRFDGAAKAYRKAVTLDPGDADTETNLGNSLHALGRTEEAAACFRRALAIEPGHLLALNNLGNSLQALGHMEEAASSFRRALVIKPDFALALGNLGNVFHIQGKLAEAEETMRRAIAAAPGLAMAHGNLGFVLRDLGRFEEAEECMNRALEIDPGDVAANANLARLLLVQGDFDRAWPYYAKRQSVRGSVRELWRRPLPENLQAKRIWLLKDQGLGDEIFFLRFAPEVKRRGGEITYLANPKIASIIARLSFIDNVAIDDKEPRGMDITLSAGDLPLVLAMKSAADIPPPYALPVEPDRGERMAARIEGLGPPPYVGLTWRAGTMNMRGSLFKEAPLADLGRALRPLNATVLVLQRNPQAGEIDELCRAIGQKAHDLTALNDDLEDMLAALSLLDEYVAVSNTNVHLRAATGRTSRILVPNPPEWRWMARGDESPWFPGCPVYRQELGGDWTAAFAALAKDLLGVTNP